MSLNNPSPIETHRETISQWVAENRSYQEIANGLRDFHDLHTTRHSIRRAVRRWGLRKSPAEKAGFKLDGNDAEIITHPATTVNTPDDLLRERGLDPADWEVTNLKCNEWNAMTSDKASGDNRIVLMKQLTVNFKRITPVNIILPARVPGDYIRRAPIRIKYNEDTAIRKIVFVGDQQAPKHDRRLHSLFLEWLEYNKPDEGVMMGDSGDFSMLSKYTDNPEWDETVQECLDATYLVKREYVQASEGTNWVMLEGNHDARMRDAILNKMPRIYDVRRAKAPGEKAERPVMSIPNLLRLDELGIKYIQPDGGYEHASHKVCQNLAARHGWLVRKGAGASALASLESLGHSVVIGHVHRQSIVHKTIHDIDGNPGVLAAMETGCMCTTDGLGYAVNPDWQNGWGTATIWPDGKFKLELATYVNETVFYRDQRYL